VTVLNESSDTLRSVVLSGSGFADTVAIVPPKEAAAVRVRPRGESAIGVAFTTNNRRVSIPQQGYFESAGGYVVVVRVDSTLAIHVRTTLERY
jgi:hypothetical protein